MTKGCPACREAKPLDAYYKRARAEQYPDSSAGYQTICIRCFKLKRSEYVKSNKIKCLEGDKAQYKKNPDRYRESNYKRNFGITLAQYNNMLSAQQERCAGCDKHQSEFKKRLAVDHDHKTGAIRGLLCQNCNRCLGVAYDSPQTLTNLAAYLNQTPVLAGKQTNVATLKVAKKAG